MKGNATGKLILLGEHAVVYGHPAIAVPVDLSTTVTLEPCNGPLQIEHALLSPRDESRLEAALDLAFPGGGSKITIESELPVGCGLGSSAAISVAVGRALGLNDVELRERAMEMERVFHGNPSGLDVAVALRGETLWFVKGKPIRVIPSPPCSIVVIDSGTSGDTKTLVEQVASRKDELDDVLKDIGALVHAARAVMEDPVSLGELVTENHGLLKKLGVSTPQLDGLVDLALGQKAYGAKLSGSGGGGVVLALCEDPDTIVRSAQSAGFEAWIARRP